MAHRERREGRVKAGTAEADERVHACPFEANTAGQCVFVVPDRHPS